MISILVDPVADPLYSSLSSCLCFLPLPSPLAFPGLEAAASIGGRAAKEYCSVASPWQRPRFLTSITRRAALLIHGTKIAG